jgi:type 1 fimbria pilin
MKKYALGLVCALLTPLALAGDGIKTIDLTFAGTVVQPSCKIVFDNDSASKTIDFGTVNVSELRYYAANTVDANIYSKTKQSDIFQMRISGCTPESVTKDSNGKQFTLTIAAGANSEWYYGSSSYMSGSLSPRSGASDFAARILVPNTLPAVAAPDSWKVLTISDATQGLFDAQSNVKGFTSSLAVSLDDLVLSGSGDNRTWAMPMRVELGMENVSLGQNVGAFSVSGVITVTYY